MGGPRVATKRRRRGRRDDDDDDADSDEPRPRVSPPLVSPIPAPAPVRPLNLRGRDLSPNGPPTGDSNAHLPSRQSRGLPPIPVSRPGKFHCGVI